MLPGHRRTRDSGASGLEYAALIGLAAVIFAVAFTGLPDVVGAKVPPAICRLFGMTCPERQPGPPPEALPCTADELTTEHNNNFQVLFYSRKEKERTIVAQRSNGEIWETTGTDTKNGFAIEVGIGFKLQGKGASISGGGGHDWGAHASTTWKFQDAAERDRFHSRVQAEQRRLLEAEGFDALDDMQEVPYEIAREMGVEYATYYGESSTGFGRVNGSFAIVSGGASTESGDEVGTIRNSDGTTIKTYKSTNTYGINGSVGIVIAEAGAGMDWANGSIISVVYDRNGRPTKAIITSDTGSSWNADVSLGKTWTPDRRRNGPPDADGNPTDDGGPQGNQGGGLRWTPWADGGGSQTTTQIHIPLENDPRAQQLVAGMIDPFAASQNRYPGGMQGLVNDFEDLVTQKGTIYNLEYGRDYSKDGLDLEGSFVVKIGGYENSTEQTRLRLEDAYIVDPRTGERREWTGCGRR